MAAGIFSSVELDISRVSFLNLNKARQVLLTSERVGRDNRDEGTMFVPVFCFSLLDKTLHTQGKMPATP